MILELAYGRGLLRAETSDPAALSETRAHQWSGPHDEADVVAAALDQPMGMPPLARAAAGARRVVVLVSGKDHVAGARIYMPAILERLAAAGIADEQIEVVCATGTHTRHTRDDVSELLGEAVASRLRFRAHDCDRAGDFVDLGATSLGTPVKVARDVVDADLRILTGRITPHCFAGFSGGRQSILPGVSARETIVANHRRTLDFASGCRIHREVFGGNLVGNPVHQDMLEAAGKTGPCFVVNTILDGRQRVSHAFAGSLEASHVVGCLVSSRLDFEYTEAQTELLVTSAGGYPYDIDLIQALKAVFNHREAVAPGGVVVLVAEAAGGVLRGMKEWMGWADRASLGGAMERSYDLAAHNSLMLRDLLDSVTIVVVSALPPEEVRSLGLVPMPTLPQGLAFARSIVGRQPRMRVVHHGNVTQTGFRRGDVQGAQTIPRAS
jgi:nickel-dependent lactate racemase